MTVSEYIQSEAINPRTASRRLLSFPRKISRQEEATQDIRDILCGTPDKTRQNGHAKTGPDTGHRTPDRTEIKTPDIRTKGQKNTRTPDKARTPDTDKIERVTVMAGPILITLISVALTIIGLYVFANWAGAGLGAMFAVYLFVTVIVARNRHKGWTSEQALQTVLHLEIGAAVLHCFTFWRLLPDFPPGDGFMLCRAAACLILAGFIAFLSYQAVQVVRTYNAEVIEPETKPT